jgi:hypothetical protein
MKEGDQVNSRTSCEILITRSEVSEFLESHWLMKGANPHLIGVNVMSHD